MHLSLRRAIALAATLWAGQASAALVTMTGLSQGFQGVGSPIGTAVSATFDLDFAGGAHVFLDRASVRSFSVQFGAIVFNSSDLTNWDFEMYTDATGAVGGLQLLASFGGTSADDLGVSLDLRENVWWTSFSATCAEGDVRLLCDFEQSRAFAAVHDIQWGSAAYTLTVDGPVQAVPEPASLALAGIAMLGLVAGSRRAGKPGRLCAANPGV